MSAFLYPVFGHPTYTSVFGYGLQVRSDPTGVRGKPDTGISEKLTISVSGFLFWGDRESKSIEDILEDAEETTSHSGVARNFEKSGGYEQTLEDFEALNPSNVKDIQTQYGPGKVGYLEDGTTVVARPGSTTGGATLEIRISNSKVYKIRY